MKITIIGTVPPPIGGVTVHTKRLFELLKENKQDINFINLRKYRENSKKKWAISYIKELKKIMNLSKEKEIIHYQLNNWKELSGLLILLYFCGKKNPVVTTVHSFRWNEFSFFDKISFEICKRNKRVVLFIAPSITTKELLLEQGIKKNKIYVLNTFIPPYQSEMDGFIPSIIREFVSKKEGIKVLANASKLYKNESGVDVYGLDMCIEACKRNKELYFLFCVAKADKKYLEESQKRIQDLGLNRRFLLFYGEVNLVSILKLVDIFVRPTFTDSYGISVEEALAMGVISLASDVCTRADGTLLFRNRDIDDFCEKIFEASSMIHFNKKENQKYKDIINQYLEIYSSI